MALIEVLDTLLKKVGLVRACLLILILMLAMIAIKMPAASGAPGYGINASGALIPVQVVYADDTTRWPNEEPGYCNPNDLDGYYPYFTVKQTLPMIKAKPTGFVGLQEDGYVIRVNVSADYYDLEGKFEIDITNAEPSHYESIETFKIRAGETREFILNPHDDRGAVTAIPFVPGSSPFVPGASEVNWEPKKYLEFKDAGASTITLKFTGWEIGRTTVEKIIETVPFKVRWKPMLLSGMINDDLKRKQIIQTTKERSESFPALFIKANYPVENPKFSASASKDILFLPDIAHQQVPPISIYQWLTVLDDRGRALNLISAAKMNAFVCKWYGYDRGVLVVPTHIIYLGGKFYRGLAFQAFKASVFVEAPADEPVEAHEILHTPPFLADDDRSYGPPFGYRAVGYLATMLEGNAAPARPVNGRLPLSLGFMGLPNSHDVGIARKDQYRELMIPRFDAAQNTELDPRIWLLRGVLDVAGSNFTADPIYQFDSTIDNQTPCSENETACVTLTLRTILWDGTVIDTPLPVRTAIFTEPDMTNFTGPEEPIDLGIGPVAEAFAVPSKPVAKIEILNGTKVLYEKTVSSGMPNLTILSPLQGAKYAGNIGVEIRGDDPDNESLFASVFIEKLDGTVKEDAGLDIPLVGMNASSEINTTVLQPGDYKIRVLLTDGFNTVEKDARFRIIKFMQCPMVYAPVCSADGNTYPNWCYAYSDGVSVACQGECPCTSVCGNDVLDFPEQCDDGNVANGDGCSAVCSSESADGNFDVVSISSNGDGSYNYSFFKNETPVIQISRNANIINLAGFNFSSINAGSMTAFSIGGIALNGTTKSVTMRPRSEICALDSPEFVPESGLNTRDCWNNSARIVWSLGNGNPCNSETPAQDKDGNQMPQYTCTKTTINGTNYAVMRGFAHTTITGFDSVVPEYCDGWACNNGLNVSFFTTARYGDNIPYAGAWELAVWEQTPSAQVVRKQDNYGWTKGGETGFSLSYSPSSGIVRYVIGNNSRILEWNYTKCRAFEYMTIYAKANADNNTARLTELTLNGIPLGELTANNIYKGMKIPLTDSLQTGGFVVTGKINFSWGTKPRNEIPGSHVYLMNGHNLSEC